MSRAVKIALLLLYAAQIIVIHRETLKPMDVGAAERRSQVEKPLARIFSDFRSVLKENVEAARRSGRRFLYADQRPTDDDITSGEYALSDSLHEHLPENRDQQTWIAGRSRQRVARFERFIISIFPGILRLAPAATTVRSALPGFIAAYSARRLVAG